MKKSKFQNLYQLSDERKVKELFNFSTKDSESSNTDLINYLNEMPINQIYYMQMLNALPYRNLCSTYNYIKRAYELNDLEKTMLNEVLSKKELAIEILNEIKLSKKNKKKIDIIKD